MSQPDIDLFPEPTALATIPAAAGPPSPLDMVKYAIEHKIDPNGLKVLTDQAERWRKMDAEQRFNESMVACQAEMPSVVKDAKSDKSTYARYETIIRAAKPVYTKHGFAVTFVECVMIGETMMRVVGDVVHKGGHVKRHTFELGLDGVGPKGQPLAMNRPQTSGSTSSYGQRYLIIRAFNIPVAGEDDDAAASRMIAVPEDKLARLKDYWRELRELGEPGNSYPAWLKWLDIERIEDMTMHDYPKAERDLQRKLAKRKGGAQ